MREVEHERLRLAEDEGWWFRARRAILGAALDTVGLSETSQIVDIGCGTGGNLAMLASRGRVVGVEPGERAAALASERGVARVVCATAAATGLESACADVVTLFDVLEHLDDEDAALREVVRVLRPGGCLVLTVPAFQALWSQHDVVLDHKRRYRRRTLRAALERAGLQVDHLSYHNLLLTAPVAALRLGRRIVHRELEGADGTRPLPPLVDAALFALFAAEAPLARRRVALPLGTSLLAIARAGAAL